MEGEGIAKALQFDSAVAARDSRGATRRFIADRLLPDAAPVVIIGVSFVADLALPRGATAAIGYCLVPVLARTSRQRWWIFFLTGICTLLTWAGYALEPPGAALWMSLFDRTMVTGVLWLTLLMVWRRLQAEITRSQHAEALRNAVRELHRSNAELENFASVVSHDLRGPLNSIALAVKIMSSQPAVKSDLECKEWIDSIVKEIARLSSLIQKLLAYGRVGAGDLKLSDCDCESVLSSVREALRAELEETSAQITNDPLPTVKADGALITELLQNLIENSIKYRGPTPPQIHVSARVSPAGWLFSVRDNGIGMSPADRAHVFDPFYRGAAGNSSSGFGIGLATCKRIVDRHGGQIELQSSPGQGSTFSFVIPRSPVTRQVANAVEP
jgi:signal transduction histidine kinase